MSKAYRLKVKTFTELSKMTEDQLNEYADEVYDYYDKVVGLANRLEENRVHREERILMKKLEDQKKKRVQARKKKRKR